MSKPTRKKKKQKKPERKGPFADHMFTGLGGHVRQGSKLQPPLVRMEKMFLSSWRDDHMPEYLWAVLLAEVLPRRDYLGCFRAILKECHPWFEKKDSDSEEANPSNAPELNGGGYSYTLTLDHTKLAEVTDEQFRKFIAIPLKHPLGYAALRPLLLLSSLPGIDRWKEALAVEPTNDDWQTLGIAIAEVLDHQSEKSTDIRWFKVMLPMLAGMMHFPREMEERVQEIFSFPDRGDMRSVRPSIRAHEMSMRRYPPSKWIEKFWGECLEKTKCLDPTNWSELDRDAKASSIRARVLYPCREAVTARFLESLTPSRSDPRLDCSFGLVLYSLSIIEEFASRGLQNGILGRLGLRAIVEANITLRYLAKKDSKALWTSYRVFGAGQAKLAFLKAQETDTPSFIDEHALHEIANEDVWQEFLEIDIGHWAKSNLRSLADECEAKDTYDRFYSWSSSFTHSHWGAVRDTNFLTCHNPLHRLHRIPRLLHRELPSIEADAITLVNEMITVLEQLYPSEEPLLRLEAKAVDEAGETAPT